MMRQIGRLVARLAAREDAGARTGGVSAAIVASLLAVLEGDLALPGRIDTRPVVDRGALERLVLIFGKV
jgi:hypothetical protein